MYKKIGAGLALAGAGITSAFAVGESIATSATNAITASQADATTVGGSVVALVAGMVVVSIIISLVKKA